MLVLTRKLNESIIIGDSIELTIVEVKGEQVKIGITAPRNISVHRKEVYEAIQRENIDASRSVLDKITEIESIFKKKDSRNPEDRVNSKSLQKGFPNSNTRHSH